MNPTKVLLADDHNLFRAGLRQLIDSQPDMVVAVETANGAEVPDLVAQIRPDVLSLDLSMAPGHGGIKVLEQLKSRQLEVHTLVVTMHDAQPYVSAAFAAGCRGYILKSSSSERYLAALRKVASGTVYIDEELEKTNEGNPTFRVKTSSRNSLGDLTERERDVLKLLAQGYTYKDISKKICLSVKTIETYRTRLSKKLGLNTKAALIRYYQEMNPEV